MLEVRNIRCRVGDFVVTAESLSVSTGQTKCLMGKSGSGKSTFLLALSGFIPIDCGSVFVNGMPMHELPPEKRKMALVFQRGALFPSMTAFQNVEFGLRVQGVAVDERRKRVLELLERFQVGALHDRLPHQLSGGEAQRVAFARALAPKFPVLLMDEPFSALDVELRNDLRLLLKNTVSELQLSALMVTHDPDDVKFFGNEALQMVKGKLVLN